MSRRDYTNSADNSRNSESRSFRDGKALQCWRCKGYGHRSGDRECPMKDVAGHNDLQRQLNDDPTNSFVQEKQLRRQEKYERVEHLMQLMEEIRSEEVQRKARKQERKRLKSSKHHQDDTSDNTVAKRTKIDSI